MISKAEASSEVARLGGLDFFPREDEARRELLLAAQAADTVEILRSVIEDWLHDSSEAPKPVNLRTLIYARQTPQPEPDPEPNCPVCHDGAMVENTDGIWQFCDCAKATALKQNDPGAVDKQNKLLARLKEKVAAAKGVSRTASGIAGRQATETLRGIA